MGKERHNPSLATEHPTSLEQLKGLNNIPDLASRLSLATALCNHGHRADMIFRWLTESLSTNPSARREPGSWNLLTQAVRLLGVSRLSTLLRTSNVVKHIDQALRENCSDTDSTLLTSINTFLGVLLSYEPTKHSALASLLRLEVEDAASLCESLMLAAWHSTQQPSLSDGLLYLLARTAIDIWNTRRTSPLEHDQFRQHCWYISAVIHAQGSNEDYGSRSIKRKRSSPGLSATDVISSLERLIAKHVYLPSRTAFLAQNASTDNPSSALPPGSFVTQFLSDDPPWDVLSAQLDIAIRCASVITYHQKMKDTEWVDAMFRALLTIWSDAGGAENSRSTVLDMLDKVSTRHKLSSTLMLQLVNSHCGLETDECDWVLLAKLLRMDGLLFTDQSVAERLFATINRVTSRQSVIGQSSVTIGQVQHEILSPLCTAFASSRKMDLFLSLWQRSMASETPSTISDIWFGLDECLEHSLETSMNPQQIVGEVTTRIKDVSSFLKVIRKMNDETAMSKLWASSVVLNGLFHSIRQVETRDAIADHAGQALDLLCTFARLKRKASVHHEQVLSKVWSLAMNAFNLWFPSFALTKSREEVNSKAFSLLQDPILGLACDSTADDPQANQSSKVDTQQSQKAARLVACFCHTLHAYPSCEQLASDLITRLVNNNKVQALHMLIAYPSLSPFVDQKTAETVLDGLEVAQLAFGDTSSKQLAATVSIVGEEQMMTTIERLLEASTVRSNQFDHVAYLHILESTLDIPSRLFTREQREKLIASLCDQSHQKNEPAALQIARLALLVHHVRLPTVKNTCLDDPEVLWSLGGAVKPSSLLDAELAAVIQLMRVVVSAVCSRWASSLTTPRSKDCLTSIFQDSLRAFHKKHLDKQKEKHLFRVIIATAVLQGANEVKVDLEPSIGHESVLNQVNGAIEQFLDKELADLEAQPFQSALLTSYLTAAHAIAQRSIVDLQNTPAFATLQQLATKIMTKFTPEPWTGDEDKPVTTHLHSPAPEAFAIICLEPSNELALLAHSACRLNAVPFPSQDRSTILASYKQATQQVDVPARLAVISGLINSSNTPLRSSSFAVIHRTLSTLATVTHDNDLHSLGILASILKYVRGSVGFGTVRPALDCVVHILRHNPALINQYEIDLTMSSVFAMAKPSAAEVLVYSDLCAVMTTLITHHRTRLNGRFHILISTLRALLGRLLAHRPPAPRQEFHPLERRHAEAFARIVTLLCEPPATHRKHKQQDNSGVADLIDRDRRVRANVGSFVPALLHSYCAMVLRNPPEDGIREALVPAVAAMLDAMNVYSSESVKVLSAAMNDSERAILRELVETWRLTHQWSGI